MFFVHHWISVTINHPLNFPSKIPSHTPATLEKLGVVRIRTDPLLQNKRKITINKIVPLPSSSLEEEENPLLRSERKIGIYRSIIRTINDIHDVNIKKKRKKGKKRGKKNKALIFVIRTQSRHTHAQNSSKKSWLPISGRLR